MTHANFEDLIGKTITGIKVKKAGENTILFRTDDDVTYYMYHEQECCESVYLEDVIGDLNCLIGSKILLAEAVSKNGGEDEDEYTIWTFYKLATAKGYVTLRWCGVSESYSVAVSFAILDMAVDFYKAEEGTTIYPELTLSFET
jgi:hypothetical protein